MTHRSTGGRGAKEKDIGEFDNGMKKVRAIDTHTEMPIDTRR